MVNGSGSDAPLQLVCRGRGPALWGILIDRTAAVAHMECRFGELLVLSSSQSSGEWRSRVLPTPGPTRIDGLGSVGGTACIAHSDLLS
jgi:hypothetical protein